MTVLNDHAPSSATRRPSAGTPPELDKSRQAELASGVLVEDTPYDFMTMAAHKDVAARVVEIQRYAILGFSLLAIILAIANLVAVYLRPNPQVLLSYPDGTLRCAPFAIDPATGRPQPRSASAQDLCDSLAGGVTASATDSLSQAEVAASESPSSSPSSAASTAGSQP